MLINNSKTIFVIFLYFSVLSVSCAGNASKYRLHFNTKNDLMPLFYFIPEIIFSSFSVN